MQKVVKIDAQPSRDKPSRTPFGLESNGVVDVSRGEKLDRVSSEWFARPDDKRFLLFDNLAASAEGGAQPEPDDGERRDPGV
jgi:hypothetical protein